LCLGAVTKRVPVLCRFALLLDVIKNEKGEERNDGLILAEASLIRATHLLSSDKHLTGIDAAQLRFVFESRHLKPVDVMGPREMARLLRRIRGG
jgi:hypothetical protein